MKFKFTERERIGDNITPDSWVEEYKSLKNISDEIKEGCNITILFTCEICKKEFETENQKEAMIGICKKCRKSENNFKGSVKNV